MICSRQLTEPRCPAACHVPDGRPTAAPAPDGPATAHRGQGTTLHPPGSRLQHRLALHRACAQPAEAHGHPTSHLTGRVMPDATTHTSNDHGKRNLPRRIDHGATRRQCRRQLPRAGLGKKGVVIGAAAVTRFPPSRGSNNLNKRIPNSAIVTTTTLNNGIYGRVANFKVRARSAGSAPKAQAAIAQAKGEEAKGQDNTLTTGVHHRSASATTSPPQCRIGVGSLTWRRRRSSGMVWLGHGQPARSRNHPRHHHGQHRDQPHRVHASQRSSLDELTSADVLSRSRTSPALKTR